MRVCTCHPTFFFVSAGERWVDFRCDCSWNDTRICTNNCFRGEAPRLQSLLSLIHLQYARPRRPQTIWTPFFSPSLPSKSTNQPHTAVATLPQQRRPWLQTKMAPQQALRRPPQLQRDRVHCSPSSTHLPAQHLRHPRCPTSPQFLSRSPPHLHPLPRRGLASLLQTTARLKESSCSSN